MRFKKLLFLSFLLAALGVGIYFYLEHQSIKSGIYTSSPYLQEWAVKWLSEGSCGVSCWNGITVGSTTADEAYDILKSSDLVMNVRTDTNNHVILWDWKKYPDGTGWREIHYDKNDIISSIDLAPTLSTFKLGDLISAYGDPTHVWTWKYCDPFTVYSEAIIYTNYGFLVIPYNAEERITSEITANLYVYRVRFSPLHSVMMGKGKLHPWNGYGNYPFYFDDWKDNFINPCRDSFHFLPRNFP